MLSKENQLPLNAIQTMINLIIPANGTDLETQKYVLTLWLEHVSRISLVRSFVARVSYMNTTVQ